ncbi:DUF4249 family protein [Robertkochia solimangrovi]|uniref:DUF4249 family protein n=1 Tax=Robertkochia solimangrovi TaxID=2213046 RepID=UPI00117C7F44|nr:DUF4249 family protein [Robertkochia solimangrovi]TRZ45408.1 hypothetical protein DMZ48_06590 [Robertkochia solimangrovi]
MKNFFLIIIVVLSFISCEDVVEIDLPENQERLVVDALLRVYDSLPGKEMEIRTTLSSNFYDSNPAAEVDLLSITNIDTDESIDFSPRSGDPGVYTAYIPNEFLVDATLLLLIEYDGKTFVSLANYIPAVPINSVVQGDGKLFSDDDTEIIINFTDDGNRDDYYLFDFDLNEYILSEDSYYQGEEFEFSFFHEDVRPGDILTITLMGVDLEFVNYMNQVLSQSGAQGQGPFQTPVSAIRGNIINISGYDSVDNIEDAIITDGYALGYFAVVQAYSKTINIH